MLPFIPWTFPPESEARHEDGQLNWPEEICCTVLCISVLFRKISNMHKNRKATLIDSHTPVTQLQQLTSAALLLFIPRHYFFLSAYLFLTCSHLFVAEIFSQLILDILSFHWIHFSRHIELFFFNITTVLSASPTQQLVSIINLCSIFPHCFKCALFIFVLFNSESKQNSVNFAYG